MYIGNKEKGAVVDRFRKVISTFIIWWVVNIKHTHDYCILLKAGREEQMMEGGGTAESQSLND